MLKPACQLLRGQVGEWYASGQEGDVGYAGEIAESENCPLSLFQRGEGLRYVETGERIPQHWAF